jgi:hypothetical protein
MKEGRKEEKKKNQSQPTGFYPNLLSLLYTTGELRILNTYPKKYIHTYIHTRTTYPYTLRYLALRYLYHLFIVLYNVLIENTVYSVYESGVIMDETTKFNSHYKSHGKKNLILLYNFIQLWGSITLGKWMMSDETHDIAQSSLDALLPTT